MATFENKVKRSTAKKLFSAYRANGKFKLADALESTRRGLIEGDKAMKLMRDIAYKKRKEAQVTMLAQLTSIEFFKQFF